jgi:hypothetical protein
MLTVLLGIFSSIGILYTFKSAILRYFLWIILSIKYYTKKKKKRLNLKMISDNNYVYTPHDIVSQLENSENFNGIILEGPERSIVYDRIEIMSFITSSILEKSVILSVSLVTEKGELDISNVLSQFIHPGQILTKEKIILLLHLSNISWKENNDIVIIDTNADMYTISLNKLKYLSCDTNINPILNITYRDDDN